MVKKESETRVPRTPKTLNAELARAEAERARLRRLAKTKHVPGYDRKIVPQLEAELLIAQNLGAVLIACDRVERLRKRRAKDRRVAIPPVIERMMRECRDLLDDTLAEAGRAMTDRQLRQAALYFIAAVYIAAGVFTFTRSSNNSARAASVVIVAAGCLIGSMRAQ